MPDRIRNDVFAGSPSVPLNYAATLLTVISAAFNAQNQHEKRTPDPADETEFGLLTPYVHAEALDAVKALIRVADVMVCEAEEAQP